MKAKTHIIINMPNNKNPQSKKRKYNKFNKVNTNTNTNDNTNTTNTDLISNPHVDVVGYDDGSDSGDESDTSDTDNYDNERPPLKKIRWVDVEKRIETLDDLIELGETVIDKCDMYAFDMDKLKKMTPTLRKLRDVIGMTLVKQQVVDMVIFNLTGVNGDGCVNYHTVIEGQPGVGKTMLGHILAEVYYHMDFISSPNVVFAKRSDLIGKYLGQTAPKTQKVIDDALGGVLFIDEVYSLGNEGGRDMYSKECIDTINRNLSEHAGEFVCIIAGYKDKIQSCFFNYNAGLERRFPYRFTILPYTPLEMCAIFKQIARREDWDIKPLAVNEEFFKGNKDYFKFMGGDLEVMFQKCKITHARRIFGVHNAEKRLLTSEDIEKGLVVFKSNPFISSRDGDDIPLSMYN